jgi:hypothetical protein
VWFRIVGQVHDVERIAAGRGVRDVVRLRKLYGGSRWRKLKGRATVELPDGSTALAEVHWYEATPRNEDQAITEVTAWRSPLAMVYVWRT